MVILKSSDSNRKERNLGLRNPRNFMSIFKISQNLANHCVLEWRVLSCHFVLWHQKKKVKKSWEKETKRKFTFELSTFTRSALPRTSKPAPGPIIISGWRLRFQVINSVQICFQGMAQSLYRSIMVDLIEFGMAQLVLLVWICERKSGMGWTSLVYFWLKRGTDCLSCTEGTPARTSSIIHHSSGPVWSSYTLSGSSQCAALVDGKRGGQHHDGYPHVRHLADLLGVHCSVFSIQSRKFRKSMNHTFQRCKAACYKNKHPPPVVSFFLFLTLFVEEFIVFVVR